MPLMFQQLEVYVSASRNSLTEMNGLEGELGFVCCAAFLACKDITYTSSSRRRLRKRRNAMIERHDRQM